MASSAVELLTPIVTLIRALNPSSILDVGVGFGKWGFLCREYLEVWMDRVKKNEWQVQLDGVEIFPDYHDILQPYLYNRIFYEDARTFHPDKTYGLVIACDIVEHMLKHDGLALIRKMSSSWAANCIISIPLGNEWMRNRYGRNPYDAHLAVWNENDLSREWRHIQVTVPDGRRIGIFFKGSGFETVKEAELIKHVVGLTVGQSKLKEPEAIKASYSYKLSRIISRVVFITRHFLGKIFRKLVQRFRPADGSEILRESNSKLPRELRHMGRVIDRFKIQEVSDEPGRSNIFWDNKVVLKTFALRDIHNTGFGDCFLVGTGPSLADIDLHKLKDRVCFGVNGAIAKFGEAKFAPKYYAISTYDFFEKRFDMVREAVESGAKCFFPFWGLCKICEQDSSILQNASVYLLDPLNQMYGIPAMSEKAFDNWASNDPDIILHPNMRKKSDRVGFCMNMEKGYFHGENILYTALQHAYYIGYRRIFILGMDLNYSGPTPRFYENASDSRPTWIDASFERSIVPCFEIVRDMCEEKRIEVYNLSPESRLPQNIIPKISFEEVLDLAAKKEK